MYLRDGAADEEYERSKSLYASFDAVTRGEGVNFELGDKPDPIFSLELLALHIYTPILSSFKFLVESWLMNMTLEEHEGRVVAIWQEAGFCIESTCNKNLAECLRMGRYNPSTKPSVGADTRNQE